MAITLLVIYCLYRKSYKISIIENCLLNTIAFLSNSGEDKSIEEQRKEIEANRQMFAHKCIYIYIYIG
jgi:hypothetical protein